MLSKILDDIIWPALILLVMWIVFWANSTYHLGFNHFGIHPRSIQGFLGIFTSPFLHGDFEHLFSNSTPFIVASSFLFYFFPKVKWKIMLRLWIFSGLGVWLYAFGLSNHIGASGVVYGLISFLLTIGVLKKNRNLMGMTMLLVFLYGSLIWGLFPQINLVSMTQISWEGHLSGAITGIVLGFIYQKNGPPEEDYDDDDEDDDPSSHFFDQEWFEGEDHALKYNYVYKPKIKESDADSA